MTGVKIPRSSKNGGGRPTHSAIPSGALSEEVTWQLVLSPYHIWGDWMPYYIWRQGAFWSLPQCMLGMAIEVPLFSEACDWWTIARCEQFVNRQNVFTFLLTIPVMTDQLLFPDTIGLNLELSVEVRCSCSHNQMELAEWVERPSTILEDLGIGWVNPTLVESIQCLENVYVSLSSQALGIIRIEQWLVGSVSG